MLIKLTKKKKNLQKGEVKDIFEIKKKFLFYSGGGVFFGRALICFLPVWG